MFEVWLIHQPSTFHVIEPKILLDVMMREREIVIRYIEIKYVTDKIVVDPNKVYQSRTVYA